MERFRAKAYVSTSTVRQYVRVMVMEMDDTAPITHYDVLKTKTPVNPRP